MLELVDILDASVGKDENGKPKSSFSITQQVLDPFNHITPAREHTFTNAIINYVINGNYIMIDFTFNMSENTELRMFLNHLEKFGRKQSELQEEDKDILFELLVVPLQFMGEYYYSLVNPIFWALQPSTFNGPIDTIRLLFNLEGVNFFEAAPVDEKEIEAEIEKEERERERLEEMERQKEIEHEEYLDRLTERFNNRL